MPSSENKPSFELSPNCQASLLFGKATKILMFLKEYNDPFCSIQDPNTVFQQKKTLCFKIKKGKLKNEKSLQQSDQNNEADILAQQIVTDLIPITTKTH